MKIDTIHEMALSQEIEAEIATLLDACFDDTFEGRSFFTHRHHLRLVMRDGGRVVGHLALGLRTIRQGGDLVDIITVGDVAAAPDRRGEGIAQALLARGIDEARGTIAPFMLLFGTAGLYTGAGLRVVRNPMRHVSVDEMCLGDVREEPAKDLMVLPLRDAVWDDTTPIDLLGAKF